MQGVRPMVWSDLCALCGMERLRARWCAYGARWSVYQLVFSGDACLAVVHGTVFRVALCARGLGSDSCIGAVIHSVGTHAICGAQWTVARGGRRTG